jgi:DNA-binding beta-propeller fold protein YncE
VDEAGNVYIADYLDDEVRKVSPRGTISRFAGTGQHCVPGRQCGDGGPATRARLFMPAGVAADRAGNVYIADSNDHEVRKVYANGIVTRFAGTGAVCSSTGRCGNGGPAFLATMETPFGIAVDASGNVYVTDFERNEVRKIDAAGTITRLAGNGRQCSTPGRCGDGLPAVEARLAGPSGVAVDAAMNLYLADPGDREVRLLAGSS